MLLGERRARASVRRPMLFKSLVCNFPGRKSFARVSIHRESLKERGEAAAWQVGQIFWSSVFRPRFFSSGAKGESRASLTDAFDRFQSAFRDSVTRRRKRSSQSAEGRRFGGARRRPAPRASTPPRARGRSSLRVRSSRSVPSRGACASRAAYVFTGRISFRRATRRARSRLTPPSPQSFSASRPLQQPCPSWRPSRCRAPRSSPPRHPSAGAAPRAAHARSRLGTCTRLDARARNVALRTARDRRGSRPVPAISLEDYPRLRFPSVGGAPDRLDWRGGRARARRERGRVLSAFVPTSHALDTAPNPASTARRLDSPVPLPPRDALRIAEERQPTRALRDAPKKTNRTPFFFSATRPLVAISTDVSSPRTRVHLPRHTRHAHNTPGR